MSSPPTKSESWYSCRNCGELYLAASIKTICPACGNPQELERAPQKNQVIVTNVVGKKSILRTKPEFLPNRTSDEDHLEPFPEELSEVQIPEQEIPQKLQIPQKPQKAARAQDKKTTRNLFTILSVWLALLAIVSYLLIHSTDDLQNNSRAEKEKENVNNYVQDSLDVNLWNRAKDQITPLAAEFFSNSSPHVLAQVCRKRPRIIQTLAAETLKTLSYPADAIPVLVKGSVAWCGEKPFVETLWKDDRDRLIELVFAEDDGEWRIDWESYARSSSMPWSVFASEDGEAVGTFRFLVRERTAADAEDGMLNIAFHDPALFHGMTPIAQTIPFIIDRKSRDARLILAALQARNENKPILRSMYAEDDLANTARVRVRIRRTRSNGEAQFTLEEVLACHWLGWDEPGITLPDAP